MNRQIHKFFVHPAAVVLFMLAMINLYSIVGGSYTNDFVMNQRDPLLYFATKQVFLTFAVLELLLSAYLLAGKTLWTKLLLGAWLSTWLLVWRLGFHFTGEANLYDFIGDLPSQFYIPARVYDLVMLVISGTLAIGNYALLVLSWWKSPKTDKSPRMTPSANKPPASLKEGSPA